jgi:hypothetical protein
MAPDRRDKGWTLTRVFSTDVRRVAPNVAAPRRLMPGRANGVCGFAAEGDGWRPCHSGRRGKAQLRGRGGGRRMSFLARPLLLDSSSECASPCGVHAQIVTGDAVRRTCRAGLIALDDRAGCGLAKRAKGQLRVASQPALCLLSTAFLKDPDKQDDDQNDQENGP